MITGLGVCPAGICPFTTLGLGRQCVCAVPALRLASAPLNHQQPIRVKRRMQNDQQFSRTTSHTDPLLSPTHLSYVINRLLEEWWYFCGPKNPETSCILALLITSSWSQWVFVNSPEIRSVVSISITQLWSVIHH